MNAPAAAATVAGDGGQVPDSDPCPESGTVHRSTWVTAAACRGCSVDLFYADRSGSSTEALAVCATCPVRAECLADALAFERTVAVQEVYGVRGGMSAMERRRLLAVDRVRQPRAACGTDSGYYRHRRLREAACESCKAAHRVATADRAGRNVVESAPTWAMPSGAKHRARVTAAWKTAS